ncbi:MAG: hypothetical protein HYZ28_28465 [Myxococcales bacterium]|nr:hypothetical protein [Myxococcales bacterium]
MEANVSSVLELNRLGPGNIPEHLLPTQHPVVRANRAELLVDGGQVFPKLLADLRGAKDSIHISHFAIGDDTLGREVERILVSKARAGVEVRVMVDPAGSGMLLGVGKTAQMLKRWERAGVQVIKNFHVDPFRSAEPLNHVEHRKFYVVDGKVAYTGGMGMQEKYRSEWHDVMIRVEGEGARQMQVDFLKSWMHLGGRIDQKGGGPVALEERFFPDGGAPGGTELQALSQVPGESPQIREAYLREIRAAKKSFYLENPYFTDARVIGALEQAARRGVDVRVVLPGKTDFPVTLWASRGEYERLLAAGVKIYEYPGMTHAKVAVRDGAWATVGSANLDSLSLNHLYEFNYQSSSRDLVGSVGAMLEADLARSKQIQPGDVGPWSKAVGKLLNAPFISYFL